MQTGNRVACRFPGVTFGVWVSGLVLGCWMCPTLDPWPQEDLVSPWVCFFSKKSKVRVPTPKKCHQGDRIRLTRLICSKPSNPVGYVCLCAVWVFVSAFVCMCANTVCLRACMCVLCRSCFMCCIFLCISYVLCTCVYIGEVHLCVRVYLCPVGLI